MRGKNWILAVAGLLLAAPAFAGGGSRGDWELGVYGGYGIPDDYEPYLPENGPLVGARLGYFVLPVLSFEVSAQRLFSDTDFEMLGVQDQDAKFDALRLNGLYNFNPGGSVRPFLTVGAGREKFKVENLGETCDFGFNAGAGLRIFPSPAWNVRLEGRYVRVNAGEDVDETQENLEFMGGLSLLFGGDDDDEDVDVGAAPAPNQRPSVNCTADRAEVSAGETATLRATASDPEGDPLTYEWSTSAGRVTGTGTSATLDFAGAAAPATATVTVRVSDGRGNTASSNCTVRLRGEAPAAQAVSCIAGGFPRNLSRLTNVDKACLDDVAARLKADPRARVVVIGHADSGENSPQSIATDRAEAVEAYLEERGIEASRITTRSEAASDPAGTEASNRRVEVWFVPEGATVPD
jgi:outer membrane protein OmpA-like peptidoglycan-associated protein/opacity protein-like surface antigen